MTTAMAASCAWAAHDDVAPGGTGDYTQASPGGDPDLLIEVLMAA